MSATPAAVRGAGGEVAIEQVISDLDVFLDDQPRQAGPAHQPLDALAGDLLTVIKDEVSPDARRPVDPAALLIQHPNPCRQAGVLHCPPRRPAPRPGVKTRTADLQDTVTGPRLSVHHL